MEPHRPSDPPEISDIGLRCQNGKETETLHKLVENARECINLATFDFFNEIHTIFAALVSQTIECINIQNESARKYSVEVEEKEHFKGNCKRYEALVNHMISKLNRKQILHRYFCRWYCNYLKFKEPPTSQTPRSQLETMQSKLERSELSSAVKNAILRGLCFLSNETLKVLGPFDNANITNVLNPDDKFMKPTQFRECFCETNRSLPMDEPFQYSQSTNYVDTPGEVVQKLNYDNCPCSPKCDCVPTNPIEDGVCTIKCSCNIPTQPLTKSSKSEQNFRQQNLFFPEKEKCMACDCEIGKCEQELPETEKSSGYATGRNDAKLSLRERCEKFKNEINAKIIEEFNIRKKNLCFLEQNMTAGSKIPKAKSSAVTNIPSNDIPKKKNGAGRSISSAQVKIMSSRNYNESKALNQARFKVMEFIKPQPMNEKELKETEVPGSSLKCACPQAGTTCCNCPQEE